MDVNIESSGKKIIDSGSFITFDDDPSTVHLKKGSELITFVFHFSEDDKSEPKVEFFPKKDPKKNHVEIKIELLNLNNTLGRGLKEPLWIAGFDNNDKIFLHLWVRPLGKTKSKEVAYTLYLEEHK